MTKVIAAFAIIVVLYIGWEVFLYWDKVSHEEETKQKQDAAAMVIGDQLPGLPYQLETSLQNARKQGATGLKNWLKAHGQSVEDPRKAWRGSGGHGEIPASHRPILQRRGVDGAGGTGDFRGDDRSPGDAVRGTAALRRQKIG